MFTKVIRFDVLQQWRDYQRLIGNRIVATNGCFDILHRGHVTYLRKARELGDILIVGVNSDRSVRELKGENRPVNTQEDRAFVLAALDMVDFVVIFDDLTAQRFLHASLPDVWVKGGDYTHETLDKGEVNAVKLHGGDVVILPVVANYSTTRCLHLIQEAEAAEAPVLEGDVSRRDSAHRPVQRGGALEEPGEDAGSVLRAPESLSERSVSKS